MIALINGKASITQFSLSFNDNRSSSPLTLARDSQV